MRFRLLTLIVRTAQGIATAVRARPKVFGAVALGVLVFNLVAPIAILSIARKPVEHVTINPWLSRLPEYLASGHVPLRRKMEFLSNMALFWFTAENPMGVEWGFVVDVPAVIRIVFTSILFGAYFALWFHRREQVRPLWRGDECESTRRGSGRPDERPGAFRGTVQRGGMRRASLAGRRVGVHGPAH